MTDNPLLEEYKICQSIIARNDRQNLNLGAFLFGGSITATGLVLSSQARITLARWLALTLLSTAVLIGLLFYIQTRRKVSQKCEVRIAQIEQTYYPNVLIGRQLSASPPQGFKVYATIVASYLTVLWIGVVWLLVRPFLH
jgi:hypothetical protein